jgi:hypothetical protein
MPFIAHSTPTNERIYVCCRYHAGRSDAAAGRLLGRV